MLPALHTRFHMIVLFLLFVFKHTHYVSITSELLIISTRHVLTCDTMSSHPSRATSSPRQLRTRVSSASTPTTPPSSLATPQAQNSTTLIHPSQHLHTLPAQRSPSPPHGRFFQWCRGVRNCGLCDLVWHLKLDFRVEISPALRPS